MHLHVHVSKAGLTITRTVTVEGPLSPLACITTSVSPSPSPGAPPDGPTSPLQLAAGGDTANHDGATQPKRPDAWYIININGILAGCIAVHPTDTVQHIEWEQLRVPTYTGNRRLVMVLLRSSRSSGANTRCSVAWTMRGRPTQWLTPSPLTAVTSQIHQFVSSSVVGHEQEQQQQPYPRKLSTATPTTSTTHSIVLVRSVLSMTGDAHQWRLDIPGSNRTYNTYYVYRVISAAHDDTVLRLHWQMPGSDVSRLLNGTQTDDHPLIVPSKPTQPVQNLTLNLQHVRGTVPVHYSVHRIQLHLENAFGVPSSPTPPPPPSPSPGGGPRRLALLFDLQDVDGDGADDCAYFGTDTVTAWYNFLCHHAGYECRVLGQRRKPYAVPACYDVQVMRALLQNAMRSYTEPDDRVVVVVAGDGRLSRGEAAGGGCYRVADLLPSDMRGTARGLLFLDPVVLPDVVVAQNNNPVTRFVGRMLDAAPNIVGMAVTLHHGDGGGVGDQPPPPTVHSGAWTHEFLELGLLGTRRDRMILTHAVDVHQLFLTVLRRLNVPSSSVVHTSCTLTALAAMHPMHTNVVFFGIHGVQRCISIVPILLPQNNDGDGSNTLVDLEDETTVNPTLAMVFLLHDILGV